MKLVAFVEVFLDQVDEFFSDVGLDLQVVKIARSPRVLEWSLN